ncbi:MAG: zinc chelation protein SecC [Chloroflexi bacterium AL-W]|nr:zinc chelation protein SecC [Chloroflexi bacterium AL-N1]NOK66602.1 zinc chelation protein SecC [Chloroflexi bacterium AL-N10]NOK71990.1 zinc chelation protein SecC [Chloroflexi bacterium AL-N5]NOK81247.1 zinc chelation protein SecC [Chloroflexi bacterium AL-W]NOK89520.1 zinc chelation protein SecC [Chloroflexi bacterium AL-N15]
MVNWCDMRHIQSCQKRIITAKWTVSMAKIGRNDPCYCGSGKKYKHCHKPIDEATQAEQRKLRQVQDGLMSKIIEQAQGQSHQIPAALARYWNGKYTADQLSNLDELEHHGASRFLTWFAFDYPLDEDQTLVEQLAHGEHEVELDAVELGLLSTWIPIRLRPYVVKDVLKGQHFHVRDMLEDTLYEVEDHSASRHIVPGEVVVVHLVPVGTRYHIAGAAAHLTDDTYEPLSEFADMHLSAFRHRNPDTIWREILKEHSELFNHFVMALPVDTPDPSIIKNFLLKTRAELQATNENESHDPDQRSDESLSDERKSASSVSTTTT